MGDSEERSTGCLEDLVRVLASADASARERFIDLTIGTLRGRHNRRDLVDAVVAEARYRSNEAASRVLGVDPRTVNGRRRRAVVMAGLYPEESTHRQLLIVGALAGQTAGTSSIRATATQ